MRTALPHKGEEHPRGCGADGAAGAGGCWACGASPRVRGRPLDAGPEPPHVRSIPAGAGPTSGSAGRGRRRAEHPRGCGADSAISQAAAAVSGASPRVRGRRRTAAADERGRRSIPAGAGPTYIPAVKPSVSREHPRGCGADDVGAAGGVDLGGASPRVRGRRLAHRRPRRLEWSIPAGAGPTVLQGHEEGPGREHPRGCGADVGGLKANTAYVGASPRVRGRHLLTWEVTARVPHFHSCASPFVRGRAASGGVQGARCVTAWCGRPPWGMFVFGPSAVNCQWCPLLCRAVVSAERRVVRRAGCRGAAGVGGRSVRGFVGEVGGACRRADESSSVAPA